MKMRTERHHLFPKRFTVKGQTVVLRPLNLEDRDAMTTFARSLPEDDLLFLQRDITQPAELERWIKQVAEGSLVTMVAWRDQSVLGYATFDRGSVRWTRHVAEIRVVVAPAARGFGIGRLLLEMVFEMALDQGVTKVVARMTPAQLEAQTLFKKLGFEQEAVLREHAMGANGLAHDLLVLSFHTRLHHDQRCDLCGTPILTGLNLDASRLCSLCYEVRYQELGGGG